MCPSVNKIEKSLFIRLKEKSKLNKVHVSIAISGLWIIQNKEDFIWLQSLKSNNFIITWVNHSFTHRYYKDVNMENNFLLLPDTVIQSEILDTERILIEHGEVPSIFFRFPGLISDEKFVEVLKKYGLVQLGSSAWISKMKKEESIEKGDIILIHGNGNEEVKALEELYKFIDTTNLQFLNLEYEIKNYNKNYILNTGLETRHRLNILEKIYGEYTNKLFQEINFQKGMKVAVIGCGSGSGIEQIYKKIGEDGRILCVDISPEQISLTKNILESKGVNNVDYVVADIEGYTGNCGYDVVYCRFVLIHLRNPIIALKNMLSFIKEEGTIACEEHNYEDIFNYPTSSAIDKYKTLLKKISNILKLDYAFGKKLYYEMNLLGIDISYVKKCVPLCNFYDQKTLLLLSLIEEKHHFISQNLIKDSEIEEMIQEMETIANKKEIIQSPGSVFQCIGKKK